MTPDSIYTHTDKKFLVRRISEVKMKKCYKQIFKLLIRENINYTKNNNGILFNLGILSDDILTIIDIILQYFEIQKQKIIDNNIYQ